MTDETNNIGTNDRGDNLPEGETSSPKVEQPTEDTPPETVDKSIPYSRFKEVNEEAKRYKQEAEEARLALEFERGKSSVITKSDQQPTLDDLRKKAVEAMQTGDMVGYMRLQGQIEQELETRVAKSTEERVYKKVISEQRMAQLAEVADTLVKQHPELDDRSPNFDAKLQADVLEWRDFYIAKGESPAKALTRAVEKIIPKSKETDKIDDPRVKNALTRGLVDSKRQPPLGAKAGERSVTTFSVERATDKEFKSLSNEEKAKMRGDFVE